jgi:hypothetical protein
MGQIPSAKRFWIIHPWPQDDHAEWWQWVLYPDTTLRLARRRWRTTSPAIPSTPMTSSTMLAARPDAPAAIPSECRCATRGGPGEEALTGGTFRVGWLVVGPSVVGGVVGLVVVAAGCVVAVVGETVVGVVVAGTVVLGVVVAGAVVLGVVVVVPTGLCGLQTTNMPWLFKQSTFVADAVGAAITTIPTEITSSEHMRAQRDIRMAGEAITLPQGGWSTAQYDTPLSAQCRHASSGATKGPRVRLLSPPWCQEAIPGPSGAGRS